MSVASNICSQSYPTLLVITVVPVYTVLFVLKSYSAAFTIIYNLCSHFLLSTRSNQSERHFTTDHSDSAFAAALTDCMRLNFISVGGLYHLCACLMFLAYPNTAYCASKIALIIRGIWVILNEMRWPGTMVGVQRAKQRCCSTKLATFWRSKLQKNVFVSEQGDKISYIPAQSQNDLGLSLEISSLKKSWTYQAMINLQMVSEEIKWRKMQNVFHSLLKVMLIRKNITQFMRYLKVTREIMLSSDSEHAYQSRFPFVIAHKSAEVLKLKRIETTNQSVS